MRHSPKKTGNPPAFGPARPARGPLAIWAIPTACVQAVAERGGFDLLEEFGYKPVNKYLPPRDPAVGRRCVTPMPAGEDRRPQGPAGAPFRLDRPAAERLTPNASCVFRHLLHHGVRRRLRPLVPAWPSDANGRRFPTAPVSAIVSLVIGGVLVTLGLLSSTFHLGHPERAWRAFSQWRSSWLSREGVAAVATYVPAAALFLAIVCPARPGIAPWRACCWRWAPWRRSGARA
jgi:hypothetical protein